MTKLKKHCDKCGKLFVNSKLISIPGVSGRFCGSCRRSEISKINKLRFKDFEQRINTHRCNSLKSNKKFIRTSKINPNYLTKDEEVFLKSKYKHNKDMFNNNLIINNIKKNLVQTNLQINNNLKRLDKIKSDTKQMDNNFKKSFKELK